MAMGIFNSTIEQGTKIGDNRGLGILGVGHVYRLRGDYRNALIYTNRSLKKNKNIGNTSQLSNSHSTLGVIYGLMGNRQGPIL